MAKKLIGPVILAAFWGLFLLSGLDIIWNWASPAHCGSLALPSWGPPPSATPVATASSGQTQELLSPFLVFQNIPKNHSATSWLFQDTLRNDFATFCFSEQLQEPFSSEFPELEQGPSCGSKSQSPVNLQEQQPLPLQYKRIFKCISSQSCES